MTHLSFEIRKNEKKSEYIVKWSEVNSSLLISRARKTYMNHFFFGEQAKKPYGIIINKKAGEGTVVFSTPTLLPGEYFLSMEQLIGKHIRRNK